MAPRVHGILFEFTWVMLAIKNATGGTQPTPVAFPLFEINHLRSHHQAIEAAWCVSHGRVALKQWSVAVKFSSRDATVNVDAL
jgi:hypothetical protein